MKHTEHYLNVRDICAILTIPIAKGEDEKEATVLRIIKEIAYRIERLENE
jgi:hypothetical protein